MPGGYSPYPVYDLKTGLYYAKEPWLAPKDAFTEMLNAQLYLGKIKKRKGTSLYVKMAHQVRAESIGASGSTNYTGTLANIPVKAGDPQSRFNFTDGTQILEDEDGDGSLSGDGTGTVNYDTGAYDITFTSAAGASVISDYQYYPGLPVTGIYVYFDTQGSSSLLMWDTKRCNQYFPLQNTNHDIVEADIWSGGNFVWAENWVDNMFVSNNLDRIKRFDGSSFNDVTMDIDGGGANDIDTSLMIFSYKQRLVLLRTRENGSLYPQRARWCVAGDWSDWTNDGYVDAPTLDWIMSASFLGDDLVIFFERSIWTLKYTGNVDLPFVWKKLVTTEGAYATFSMTSFANELIALGPTGLISTDGFDVTRIEEKKIPDIALEIDIQNYGLCYAAILEEERESWMTYPQIGSSYPDRILTLNYMDNSWSIYDIALQCIGYWQQSEDPTLDQIDQSFNELERTFDERTKQAGYPITLGGTYEGKILQLNDEGDDLGAPIKLKIKTGRWNPFWKQGREARLGWIEFLFTKDPGISVFIDLYTGFDDSTPYKTEEISLDGDGEKVWKTIYSGEVGDMHQLVIRHEAIAQTCEIHAVIPWFRAAGDLNR